MRVIACLLMAWGLGVCSAAWSQNATPPGRVTVNLEKIPLRAALKEMFAGTSLKYEVHAGVPDVPVSLNVRNIPPEAAMRILVRQVRNANGAANLCEIQENGIHRLRLDRDLRAKELAAEDEMASRRPPPRPVEAAFRDPRLERKVTRSFKKQTLGEIVHYLFTGTGCTYGFTGKSNELVMSLELKDVTLLDGLRKVVATAQKSRPMIGLWRGDADYLIGPRDSIPRRDQP